MPPVVVNALKITAVPSASGPNGAIVLAAFVPTILLLDRIPDTRRIGDYLLMDHHPATGSVFDSASWDGVYDYTKDKPCPENTGT